MSDEDHEPDSGNKLSRLEPTELGPPGDEKHQLLMQTLSEAQVDFLMQRTPKREIKMRQGRGGMQFAYVEHGYVTERLNIVFGFNWDFEIVSKQILDDEAIVEARLTVRTPSGQTIVKTQFGGAEIKRHTSGPRSGRPISIADDYKAAASDALKKCASLLGIGLDLYGRDRAGETEDRVQAQAAVKRERPEVIDVGTGISAITGQRGGLCTSAQVSRIGKLAAQAGMSLEGLCVSLQVTDPAQLTEARAQRVISRLQQLAEDVDGAQAS